MRLRTRFQPHFQVRKWSVLGWSLGAIVSEIGVAIWAAGSSHLSLSRHYAWRRTTLRRGRLTHRQARPGISLRQNSADRRKKLMIRALDLVRTRETTEVGGDDPLLARSVMSHFLLTAGPLESPSHPSSAHRFCLPASRLCQLSAAIPLTFFVAIVCQG